MMTTHKLSVAFQARHALKRLCAAAIQRQLEQGVIAPTRLRQRRRHLLKHLHKRLRPCHHYPSPSAWLRAASLVLALWGMGGLVLPTEALAAPVFKHVMLNGFDVGGVAKPTFVDIDNDGDLDAFVGDRLGTGLGTVKYYRNNGSPTAPTFTPVTGTGNPLNGFVVGASAAPVFADIDGDGDLDAVVGREGGTVGFYRNDGTATTPNFTPVTGTGNPLNGFNVGSKAVPTLVDIDNDGDLDAFVGEISGTVKYYRNDGSPTAPTFTPVTGTGNPLNAFDVGKYAAPTFADIDNDGDLDAFVGGYDGTVRFYRNDGTATAPTFVAIAGTGNPLNGFVVGGGGGNAAPTFADIDNDGDLDAFVGDFSGTVVFYRNNGSPTAPNFTPVPETGDPLNGFNVGSHAAPTFVDIDNDGDLDAFVGEYYGTVRFYRNDGTATAPTFVAVTGTGDPLNGFDVSYYAVPTFVDIDGDGDLDAFVGEYFGTVKYYRNDGTATNPTFVAVTGTGNPLNGFDVGSYAAPTFADIDNDGDLDAFVGGYDGTVGFYRNDGTATTPNFTPVTGTGNPLNGFNVGSTVQGNAVPTFVDIDNDGDLDAFVGEVLGTVKYYRNDGSPTAPTFTPVTGTGNPLNGFGVGNYAAPTFADIDNDGDLDAFVGEWFGGKVYFFENLGTPLLLGLGNGGRGFIEQVKTVSPHANVAWPRLDWGGYNGATGETRPVSCDVDGDGRDEVVVGLASGGDGWLEVLDDAAANHAHLAWLRINWSAYNTANGETFPACGDVDGDGKAEIVVGLGQGGGGWLKAFDDASAGFTPLAGTPRPDGWILLGWGAYQNTQGETHPAIGNLDGDAAEELVIGLGNGGKGWVRLLDDAGSGFTALTGAPISGGWAKLQWGGYNNTTGETRPAVCDLNGDGQGEVVLGLASGGQGFLQALDSNTGFTPLAGTPTAGGWVRVNWGAYNSAHGESFPACGNVDGDGKDELAIGLGTGGQGFVEIKDDVAAGLGTKSWVHLHWGAYNSSNGLVRPTEGR